MCPCAGQPERHTNPKRKRGDQHRSPRLRFGLVWIQFVARETAATCTDLANLRKRQFPQNRIRFH